ncbi:MAG: hypothetical protein SV422_07485 [Pseudomonadota bacterium]|nr:hypothetical protein [Pseudomonadota bacterium]
MTKNTGSDEPGAPRGNSAAKPSINQASPEWRAIWLRCVEAAHTEWSKVPYNDLALSGGDARKLVMLLEKHYDLADGEAWRKVEAFLRQCQPRI